MHYYGRCFGPYNHNPQSFFCVALTARTCSHTISFRGVAMRRTEENIRKPLTPNHPNGLVGGPNTAVGAQPTFRLVSHETPRYTNIDAH